jgi:hypothetical protein
MWKACMLHASSVYKYAPATCHNVDILIFVYNFWKATIYATSWKVAGLIPDEFIGFFNWPNPFNHIMALRLTQPLTKTSTRNLSGGKGQPVCKAENPPPCEIQLSRKYGRLDISQSYGPPRTVTELALPITLPCIQTSQLWFSSYSSWLAMSTEAEGFPLPEATAKQQLVKTEQT